MEQVQRIFLYVSLVVISLLLWNTWNKEHSKEQVSTQQTPQVQATIPNTNADLKTTYPTVSTTPAAADQPTSPPAAIPKERIIQVHTDVLTIGIDTLGGNIVNLSLPQYPEKIHTSAPFQLLSSDPNNLYIAESALMSESGPDNSKQLAQYSSDNNDYSLQSNAKNLTVNLHWKNNNGLEVTKTFTLTRGSYVVNVAYEVINKSNQPWKGQLYSQITRKDIKTENGGLFQIHPYFGAAISSPDKRYQELTFKEIASKPVQQSIQNGWAAMVQRYFLSAWIPNPNQTFNYYSNVTSNDIYTIGMMSPTMTVAPNTTQTVSEKFYSGPAIASVLKNIAPGLDLTISYGWLWFISSIIFWVMEKIYSVVGNWGWAIIIVTLLIKLMFYHLSAKSYKSMAKMRNLQPKIQALKERFPDDKQKQSQGMMELYKKEKVNPLGGCLPILVQIPVFFALYMVLIESVQLRQAPWILWIHDLSVPDPYFVLPVIMGITMFIQQKLNPPPPDPTQAKMMMILPVVFTVLFAYFPAGLVLYWAVNNGLSILQQWWITQKYQLSHAKKK